MVVGNPGVLFSGSPYYWERGRKIKLGLNELDFLSVNLVPRCNYQCINCLSGVKNLGLDSTLSLEDMKRVISQATDLGARTIEISGEGEPLMDWDTLEGIIKYCSERGLIVALFSNGYLLDEKNINFFYNNGVSLSISLSYFYQEAYERACKRGGSFRKVIKNIGLAREIYGQHQDYENSYRVYRLAVHSIVNSQNLEQIPEIAMFCSDDIFYSAAPIAKVGAAVDRPELFSTKQEEINRVVRRYSKGNLILSDSALEETGLERCGTFFYGIGVRYNGGALFDAHAYETEGSIGNVRDLSLRELIRRQRGLREMFYERFGSCFCPLRDEKYGEFVLHLQNSMRVT